VRSVVRLGVMRIFTAGASGQRNGVEPRFHLARTR
jgi:hypothetical protein